MGASFVERDILGTEHGPCDRIFDVLFEVVFDLEKPKETRFFAQPSEWALASSEAREKLSRFWFKGLILLNIPGRWGQSVQLMGIFLTNVSTSIS